MRLMGRLHPDGSLTDVRYVSDYDDQTGLVPVVSFPAPAPRLTYDAQTQQAVPAAAADVPAALRRIVLAMVDGSAPAAADVAAVRSAVSVD